MFVHVKSFSYIDHLRFQEKKVKIKKFIVAYFPSVEPELFSEPVYMYSG